MGFIITHATRARKWIDNLYREIQFFFVMIHNQKTVEAKILASVHERSTNVNFRGPGRYILTRGRITGGSTSEEGFSTVSRWNNRWAGCFGSTISGPFRTLTWTHRIVIRYGERQNYLKKNGVYKVPRSCGISYIGQTGECRLA